MVRILITGSRDWPEPSVVWHAINEAINELHANLDEVTIVHGECEFGGADKFADDHAKFLGVKVDPHPVTVDEKRKHGKRAYFLRNKRMVDAGAEVCLAFNKGDSRGTSMTIGLAKAAGIPVKEYKA
jgi:hypothetical protein